MPQTLNLKNWSSLNIVDQTQLTANTAAAASSLPVQNAENFTSGYLLLGAKGSKTAELLPNTSASSGTTIALTGNAVLAHNQYDPVIALFGSKLRIYRAPNANGSQPADSSFSLLATIDIDPNDDNTQYTDSSGGGNYWYKYTFYNPGNLNETDLASSTAVRGAFRSNYCSIDEVREEAGFKYSTFIGDAKLDEHRQAAQDIIDGSLDEFYETPFSAPINDDIRRITKRLAAGFARQAQYSQVSDRNVNGERMVDGAMHELKLLQTKQRVVVSKDGTNMAQVGGTGEAEGWPNETTSTTAGSSGGAPRVFRMSDVQGQPLTTDGNGNPSGNVYYGRRW